MKFGIAGRLAILLTGFAAAVAGVTGYEVYSISRDLLSEAAQSRLLTTTQVLGRRVSAVIDGAVRDTRRIANDNDVAALLAHSEGKDAAIHADEIAKQFEMLLHVSPEYYQARLISSSENGLERVRIDRDSGEKLLRVNDLDLQEKGHYPYVFESLKLPVDAVYVSPVTINHEFGAHAGSGAPTLRVAVPVYGEGNASPLGMVVINLSLSGIFSVLGEDLPRDLELYLADGRGEFLMHPDPAQAFAFDRGQSARVQDQFPATAALIDGSKKMVQTTEASRDGIARAVAAAFVRIDKTGIGSNRFIVIGLAQSLDAILANTRDLSSASIFIVLGCAFLSLIFSTWLGRTMTEPLRMMAESVARFPAQHLGANLPVTRTDELGTLARGLVAMDEEITRRLGELNSQGNELARQARHDPLTGLPNRLLFNDRIEQAITRARRSSGAVALLFIDLDGFKIVNDQYGHAAGDVVLLAVASRLRAAIREMDTAARIGGDEFVIVIEGTKETDYLRAIANKLIDEISLPVEWQGAHVKVGASMGIACFPRDGESADALTSCADSAMYQAKRGGGNRAVFASAEV